MDTLIQVYRKNGRVTVSLSKRRNDSVIFGEEFRPMIAG